MNNKHIAKALTLAKPLKPSQSPTSALPTSSARDTFHTTAMSRNNISPAHFRSIQTSDPMAQLSVDPFATPQQSVQVNVINELSRTQGNFTQRHRSLQTPFASESTYQPQSSARKPEMGTRKSSIQPARLHPIEHDPVFDLGDCHIPRNMVYTSRREDNDMEMVRTKLRRNLIFHKDYQEFYNSREG